MLSIICEAVFKGESGEFSKSKSYSNLITNSHVESLHASTFFTSFIQKLNDIENLETDEAKKSVETLVADHMYLHKDDEAEKYDLVCLAISSLQCFVQANWLGPLPEQVSNLPMHLQKNDPTDLPKKMFFLRDFFNNEDYEVFQEKLRTTLTSNGEYVKTIVKCIHFLLFAKVVLVDCASQFQAIPFINWWSLRVIYLYQQLFDERTQTLSDQALGLISDLSEYFNESAKEKYEFLKAYDSEVLRFATIIFRLEASNVYYLNYNWTKAQEEFSKALRTSDISFELTGIRGKRTKFQQSDLAQLMLKVNDTNAKTEHLGIENNFQQWTHFNKELTKSSLPKNIALNDDTLLDKVKITNSDDEKLLEGGRHWSQLEYCVLYGFIFDFRKNSSLTELTHVELIPFIEYILTNSVNWCVHVVSMLMRTKLEAPSGRRMERSLMQLETLIENYYTKATDKASASNRHQFFYTISFPPSWVANKDMADYYKKLGLFNSALEIFTKLQMYSEVIECYQALDKKDQAETMIRERLAVKETPDLYCSLGEVTAEIKHFEKAIELSKGKSARGYRMLAKYQFSRQQYLESITNFEKSLLINPMQYNAWFMLGSASFRSDQWEIAIKAFRRCTHLEPDSHETWNNLAASYIKSNDKNKAHAVFQEALKYSYDNVKIWENFLWTSTDCCYFEDVVRAYNRLIDLKEKYMDDEVLRALKVGVETKMKDPNGTCIHSYKKSVLKLFGRIASSSPNNWKFYWYYAEIILQFGITNEIDFETIEITPENADKALNLFYKSFRLIYNAPNWDVSVETCDEILTVASQLITKCLEYGKNVPSMSDIYCSLNLTIKALVTKLKKKYSVDKNNNEDSKYEKLLYLTDVNEKFVQLQEEHEKFKMQLLRS